MLNLSTLDAKLQYIRNWQALQDFGITYFLVKVGKSRKEVSLAWLLDLFVFSAIRGGRRREKRGEGRRGRGKEKWR